MTASKIQLRYLALTLIVLAAAILRIYVVINTNVNDPIRADAEKYASYAYNLKNFGIYSLTPPQDKADSSLIKPDALVSPGYPLFLMPFVDAIIFTPLHYKAILIVQAVLSAITVLMVYFIFTKIAGAAAGLLTATLTALSPHLMNMNVYVLTETLFCFFLVAFILSISQKSAFDRPLIMILAGCLLGAATLTRPWTQGFIFILLIYTFFFTPKTSWRNAASLLIGFGLVITPWVIRNYINLGFASDPSLSIISIYHGSFPNMMYKNIPNSFGFAYRWDPRAGELSSSFPALWAELVNNFHSDPWSYIKWYGLGKINAVFAWNISGGVGGVYVYPLTDTPFRSDLLFGIIQFFMYTIHNALTIAGLMMCCLIWLPRRYFSFNAEGILIARCISLLFFYFVILHIIGAPYSRYSIPMRPLLYGMAIVGIITTWTRAKNLVTKFAPHKNR